jgi:hypothetical protein
MPKLSSDGIVCSRRRTRTSTRIQLRSENAARETGAFAALRAIVAGTSTVRVSVRLVHAVRSHRETGHR